MSNQCWKACAKAMVFFLKHSRLLLYSTVLFTDVIAAIAREIWPSNDLEST